MPADRLPRDRPGVVLVVGARPNFVKAAPLFRALQNLERYRLVLVHTGQHYDDSLTRQVWEDLGLPAPDHDLGIGSGSRDEQVGRVRQRLARLLPQLGAAGVVVFGDVNSTLGAALAADDLGVPLAHVEAGLRSFKPEMAEERNRVAVDGLSHLLFTTEPSAVDNLAREGFAAERVFQVGNLMIDSMHHCWPRIVARRPDVLRGLGLPAAGHLLLTLHRQEILRKPKSMADILQFLDRQFLDQCLDRQFLDRRDPRRPVIFPVHPATSKVLVDRPTGRVVITPPLAYLDFLALVSSAHAVLTDSGGVQEETTALGVPCLTLREETERPITVTHGTNSIVGLCPNRISAALASIPESPPRATGSPPACELAGWDGRAAHRIASVLQDAW